ncbi:mechanosensitive ion channel domain-containing protein [Haloplanus aerogenes]|uniref:Mechanosensitive ion channel protein MscS n=1 Tax=Haloplanus aerogenes TaxID=660522 RepID=A0A3M0CWP9_9EURY|nr:mechanosensitive ion channel domain-containing protein [Haloplanus aerogenes]AZH25154.1 mechanosensitive ion channel protein MscS [Haloplanus aerogenes]RMB13618.1 mechanosensitive ion channel-like protein [Haloplanus aerogenes]
MRGALLQSNVLGQALVEFVGRLTDALPTIITGLVFFLLAAVLVKLVLATLRGALARTMVGESPIYRQFLTTVVAVFLWFGVGLSTLSVVGLDGIAASLGTAAGFVALGVSYATSDMIADAVAGVYLLRDPDFEAGDTVRVGDMEGVVESIELRKTRFAVGEDTVVRGNADIEARWTKVDTESSRGSSTVTTTP